MSVGDRSVRCALVYLVLGLFWVLGTDQALSVFGEKWFVAVNEYMGMAFVVVTAVFICVVLRSHDEVERSALTRHYEYIVKYANDILVLLDEEFRIVEANERAGAAYGYARDELIGMSMRQFRAEQTRASLESDLARLGDGGRVYETVHQRRDGSTFPVEISARRIDIKGRRFYQGMIRDISERKQMEDVVAVSRQRLMALLDSIPDPTWMKDGKGRLLAVNNAYAAATGKPARKLVGKTDFDIWPAENAKHYRDADEKVISEKSPIRIDELLPTNSGMRWFETINSPVFDAGGKVIGTTGIAHDITERKQAEIVSGQLAAIVRSSHDAIIGKDLAGVVTSWNPGAEAIYGYRAEEMIGKPIDVLAPADKKHEIPALLERVRRGESVMNYETERFHKDGSHIDVSVDLSPVRDIAGHVIGTSAIVRDISARKQAERALQRVNRALKVLSACNALLVHANQEQALLSAICRLVVDLGGYRLAWVGFTERDAANTLRVMARHGHDEGYLDTLIASWNDSGIDSEREPMGTAIGSGTTEIVQDCLAMPGTAAWRAAAGARGHRSIIALPLTDQGRVLGALGIYSAEANAFNPEEVRLLEELAADLSFGIATLRMGVEHKNSAERLQRNMEDTIAAMASTVEKRDPYTAGHQRRVAELAVAIGREMGLPEQQLHGIRLGATIHDIGKIYIPAEILNRPGRLNEHEIGLIRTHPSVGYDIVKDIDFIWPVKEMIAQHHERLDGSGYPAGLKGEQIALEARIVAVADVVEAISSHRPYRPSLGVTRGLEEIKLWSGQAYDPAAVSACLRLFEEKRFAFDFDQPGQA